MALLFLAFVLIPIAELFVLIRIGRVIGPWYTILGVVIVGAIGAVLAKAEGRRVIEEWRASLREGRVPEDGVLGGFLVLMGAILLITPGVITDVVGLVFLLPWTRRMLTRALHRALEKQLLQGTVKLHTYGFGFPAPAAESAIGRKRPPAEFGGSNVVDTEGEEVR